MNILKWIVSSSLYSVTPRCLVGFPSGPGPCLPKGVDDLLVGAAGGRAAADDPVDVVPGHEVERPGAGTDHRLPALDRPGPRARHQRDLAQLVAAVGHRRRDRVVLALVGEGALVECLEDDLDLLLEQRAVGVLIAQRRSEGVSSYRYGNFSQFGGAVERLSIVQYEVTGSNPPNEELQVVDTDFDALPASQFPTPSPIGFRPAKRRLTGGNTRTVIP